VTSNLHRFDQVDSTNSKLKQLVAKGAEEGSVVIAAIQSAGRGTHQRTWHSPFGGLYLSILLRSKSLEFVTDLSLVGGAALAQAISSLIPNKKDVSVKWPNDCLIHWKKVAGVLCEVCKEGTSPLVIIGIGLNVNIAEEQLKAFAHDPFSATSLMIESGGESFDLDKVSDAVISNVFSLYEKFQQEGFNGIKPVWEKYCHMIGKKVRLSEAGWVKGGAEQAKKGVVEGTFLGIDEKGAIVLSDPKGGRQRYYSGRIACFWP